MTVQDVINELEVLAPLHYAEDFDNVGLLVGDKSQNVTGVLVTLDTLEAVVDEAIAKQCNLIVSFHPIVFKGLKKITGKTYVERVVIKAIQHNIAIYSIHTALDNAFQGVNAIICNQLGLEHKKVLIPQTASLKKLQTYVPKDKADALRQALFSVGAGQLGNYDSCSFNVTGEGTYKANAAASPTYGKNEVFHTETEIALSLVFSTHVQQRVIQTLLAVHPYEEVAYEISTLDNTNPYIGMGMIGQLPKQMTSKEALDFVKAKMNTKCIRHSQLLDKPIKNIAVLGGSGSFAIGAAIAAEADLFITADLKYHDFFSAEKQIILADIGHYESEQFTKNFLVDYLSKKITNFAIILSQTNTNPVKYL